MILGNKSKGLYKSRFKVREMGEVQITQRKKKPKKLIQKKKTHPKCINQNMEKKIQFNI